ncbi:hypothetical protein BH09ACT6_BH09ACT6_18730 [soil metagenome]
MVTKFEVLATVIRNSMNRDPMDNVLIEILRELHSAAAVVSAEDEVTRLLIDAVFDRIAFHYYLVDFDAPESPDPPALQLIKSKGRP